VLTSLVFEGCLRLQGLVEPRIGAIHEVEGTHIWDVTGLGCFRVIAWAAIDVLDRA
jgi:hypothetical protein